jgi:hypothetical protein
MTKVFEFASGKYRVERADNGCVKAFREGVRWPVVETNFAGSRFLHAMLDEIEWLRTELDALREDAERYRWMRISLLTLHLPIGCSGTGLDAAIDTARKAYECN